LFPKKLAIEDQGSTLREEDNGKKSKKQPDNPATLASVEVVGASTEATNTSAAAAKASTEDIGTTLEAIGTSTDVCQIQGDPPLT
jgi:hypothetical protein